MGRRGKDNVEEGECAEDDGNMSMKRRRTRFVRNCNAFRGKSSITEHLQLMGETRVPGENHRLTQSHILLSLLPRPVVEPE